MSESIYTSDNLLYVYLTKCKTNWHILVTSRVTFFKNIFQITSAIGNFFSSNTFNYFHYRLKLFSKIIHVTLNAHLEITNQTIRDIPTVIDEVELKIDWLINKIAAKIENTTFGTFNTINLIKEILHFNKFQQKTDTFWETQLSQKFKL